MTFFYISFSTIDEVRRFEMKNCIKLFLFNLWQCYSRYLLKSVSFPASSFRCNFFSRGHWWFFFYAIFYFGTLGSKALADFSERANWNLLEYVRNTTDVIMVPVGHHKITHLATLHFYQTKTIFFFFLEYFMFYKVLKKSVTNIRTDKQTYRRKTY